MVRTAASDDARSSPEVGAPNVRAMPSSTRRIVFGGLSVVDAPRAAAGRIRAAISLGLLADGERLPRESALAAQLGITTFSLREALGQLRAEGLIETRAGKYGGSVVKQPADRGEQARRELAARSSAELRDLGDWRRMLVGQAAELAARRATDAQVSRLSTLTDQVARAKDGAAGWQAHGRFLLELAAATSSTRITRMELAAQEEIDWLFAPVPGSPPQWGARAAGLHAVVAAVRRGRPGPARIAAERCVDELVAELTQLRLQVMASSQAAADPAGRTPDGGLAAEVESLSRTLVDGLEAVALACAPHLGTELSPNELEARVAVDVLSRFDSFPPLVDGAGVIADVGAIPSRPYWIKWWHRAGDGTTEETEHELDPGREDFYDYESREFIAHARAEREPWASGPYVDYGGVDDYTITVSVPILRDERFLGVAAADILAAVLERRLAPWLAAASRSCLLLNAEGTVLASNAATHQAGDVARAVDGYAAVPFAAFGWSLLVGPTAS